MNRQNVLRGNRHQKQQRDQQPLEQASAFAVLLADHGQGLVGQRMGQAGLGNRHGKGAQQGVGQCHGCAAAQAFIEGCQRAFNTQTTEQTTGQGADNQGYHHMHTAQTENQHDPHCRNDCVHRFTPAI